MNQSKADPHGLQDELSARQAAEILGVKLPTLYAYVSRGLLRSTPTGKGRARRYLRADVEALRRRGRGRGDAGGALRWGEPLLETSITEMTPEGPRYAGHLARDLARDGVSFESVAELLWTGSLPAAPPRFSSPPWPDTDALLRLAEGEVAHTAWAALVVAALATRDPGRHDRRPRAVTTRGRALVRALAATLALPGSDPARVRAALAAETTAESVAIALGVRPRRAVLAAIDAVLVLMADHELNASTFAARVSASTGADLYACIQSGLATLSGPLHGAASDQVEALLAEVKGPDDAERVVRERDRRGEHLPGFGHPFYPGGDPRVEPVLDAAFEAHERSADLRRLAALADVMERAGRPRPNVDFAIVGLRAALGMPRGAGAGLFVVARSAGWIAHVLEQAREGTLIRPRARYRAPNA